MAYLTSSPSQLLMPMSLLSITKRKEFPNPMMVTPVLSYTLTTTMWCQGMEVREVFEVGA